MKKYKVVALSVGADSNKIFNAGDIVSEDAWQKGRAEELVKQGFMEEYKGKDAVTVPEDVTPEDPQLGDHATNEAEQGLPVAEPAAKSKNKK